MIIARIHTNSFDPATKASVWKETELEELNEEGLREAAHQCDRLKEEITDKLEALRAAECQDEDCPSRLKHRH